MFVQYFTIPLDCDFSADFRNAPWISAQLSCSWEGCNHHSFKGGWLKVEFCIFCSCIPQKNLLKTVGTYVILSAAQSKRTKCRIQEHLASYNAVIFSLYNPSSLTSVLSKCLYAYLQNLFQEYRDRIQLCQLFSCVVHFISLTI